MSLRNLAASNMYETTLSWINNKDDPYLIVKCHLNDGGM